MTLLKKEPIYLRTHSTRRKVEARRVCFVVNGGVSTRDPQIQLYTHYKGQMSAHPAMGGKSLPAADVITELGKLAN